MKSKIRWTLFLAGGFFLLADRVLKYFALHYWPDQNLLTGWLGWSPWQNSGAIFSLPFSGQWVGIISIPLVIGIFILFIRQHQNYHLQTALYLVLLGAVSNLADRLIYRGTIDYFLIFTGIINLADILIIAGAGWFMYFSYYKKQDGTSG